LRGISRDGYPRYDWRHVDLFPLPPALAQRVGRVEVWGNDIYVSGWAAGDPSPDHEFDGWKSMGRRLVKYSSLPTSSGWPRPTWAVELHVRKDTNKSADNPVSFAVSPAAGKVAVGYSWDPATNQGYLRMLSAKEGDEQRVMSPVDPSLGPVGWLDMARSVTFKTGRVWV